jgi:hypothetical protein
MCRAEVPVPAQMWGGVEPSPGADVGGVEPSPGADVGGVEPSSGADVQGKGADLASHWRLEALRWSACVDYGASHRRWLLWTGIVSGQEALTFFLRTNLDMETLAQVPPPHLHGDWAHRRHICTGTGPTAATSAPGLGALLRCVDTSAACTRFPRATIRLGLVAPCDRNLSEQPTA